MKGRIPAALGVAALLVTATTAWAAFTPEGSPYPSGGAAPYTVAAADFNGDGLPDFAAINGDSANVSVYLRGAGGFSLEGGSPFPGATSNGITADFNGDGRPDLAIAGFGIGEGLAVLLRNAGGGFTREATPGFGGRLSAVGAGDFNGDGRTDLAVAEWTGGNISILLRNATNDGFTLANNYAAGINPRSIAVADFDGDGDPDLAIANNGSANLTILINAGGTFTPAVPVISVGAAPSGIVAADFDGNGRPDLAVTNYGDSTVSVLLRDAANNGFTPDAGSPVAVGGQPVGIAAADFDKNGLPDIAVAANAGTVDVLHRGAGGMVRDTPTAVEGAPNGLAVADFNGDSYPDLVVSSLATNSVTALLTTPPAAPPAPTATPTPTATPVRNKSVAAETESGKVLIKVNGKFVALKDGVIANGSEIDARKGRVGITTSTNEQADFYAGIFKISQTGGLTTLTLSEKLTGCPKAKKSSATATAAAKKPKTRKLWGDGKGKFRTKGQYSAATIRGTKWLVTDTCTTTVTKVSVGAVNVRDNVKGKTVIVRKGKHYTARKKR